MTPRSIRNEDSPKRKNGTTGKTDEEFDRVLKERYPDGWEFMLHDWGTLCNVVNAIMKAER